MPSLKFQLFGKFSVQRDTQSLKGLDAGKDQELLSYLLVRRDRCHQREALASLLWGDTSTERSKKYLRQSLWHVHTALQDGVVDDPPALTVGHDWIQLNMQSGFSLDIELFERASATVQGIPGRELDAGSVQMLKEAAALYKGDLLEGWYQDWCLFERERLQNLYLLMLDKLLAYSERHREYEAGQGYGSIILSYDRARERTHRQLMLLKYRAGDRTAALRQYERCVRALAEELDVAPQKHTTELYDQIRADRLDGSRIDTTGSDVPVSGSRLGVLRRMKRLQAILAAVQKRVQRDIEAVEQGLETIR
ncbi:MAG TPA: bacterial transcriptional activator domain-containing protein [Pyrinomonadaceae bacterium]|jgi:DNA-binding SARP family transcriptional activator|nr:bacterial transcriptional activator domain-containing protein [Pyrinomonadaceae bacterium]